MKLAFSLSLLLVSAEAFAPATFGVRPQTQLFERPDSSTLVEKALAASKEFGPASVEARLAWEDVEEMDSSDNSAAMSGGLDEECEVEGPPSAQCLDYGDKLDQLTDLVKEHAPTVNKIHELATEMQKVKISTPEVAKSTTVESTAFKAALAEAKAATEEFGGTSPEARVAWDTVEEVAAAESHAVQNYNSIDLDEQCLVDASNQACQALEELNPKRRSERRPPWHCSVSASAPRRHCHS